MLKTIILRDEKLEEFKHQMNVKYDYILLEIDDENKKSTYIVEDAIRFNIDYNLALKFK